MLARYIKLVVIFTSVLTHDTEQRTAVNNGLDESSCLAEQQYLREKSRASEKA